MEFINYLLDKNNWLDFLKEKEESEYKDYLDIENIKKIIDEELYIELTNKILDNSFFSNYLKKKEISKLGTTKKRIVYYYNDERQYVLKFINQYLYKYDYLFSDNVFSFRKKIGVKTAIDRLVKIHDINEYYIYKVDIHSYFNSIDQTILLDDLKTIIKSEYLLKFFEEILSIHKVKFNNEIIEEDLGALAGIPISSFFANFYLRELDWYFYNKNVHYYRYADDIIVFSKSKEELDEYREYIINFLHQKKLTVNPKKEEIYSPSEPFEFLGFKIDGKKIDISEIAKKKMKGKIRRAARKIRRWSVRKNVKPLPTIKVMTARFNKKFFGKESGELSWIYWFFPSINTSESLKEIDQYLQEQIRFMVTGAHNKKNFKKVPYELLKKGKYKSLVHEYYKFKLKNNIL